MEIILLFFFIIAGPCSIMQKGSPYIYIKEINIEWGFLYLGCTLPSLMFYIVQVKYKTIS